MRVPVSWLRELVDLPDSVTTADLAARWTALGLKLESLGSAAEVRGPLVVGRVLSAEPETHRNGKTIRWCQVDIGDGQGRGIVCGASNLDAGDLVVVALPGAVLPGDFAITARTTYGHLSDGMICSPRELGLGDDHDGILVLAPDEASAGDDAAAVLGLGEEYVELEITPDRAYAMSMRGAGREAALAYGAVFDDPAGLEPQAGPGQAYPALVVDAADCPVFVTRTVTGFDPSAPTPRWLARRLQLAGMRPISLAVDITNYVMLELGQPIHGYDRDRLQGPLVVRRAAPGQRLRTLDGTDRALDPDDLLITDDSGPIGLAGVMGGEATEIGPTTSAVVVEAAHFAPQLIARTARRHKLGSEASRRNERGVDPTLPRVAAQRVVDLLVQLGGGTAEPGETIVGEAGERAPIEIAADLPSRVTGMQISRHTAVSALTAVGCDVSLIDETLTAVPPQWRPDITDPFDLVEEVARVVGYDRVPSVLPVAPVGRGLTARQRLRRRVGHVLAGQGLTEVIAYPFIGQDQLDLLGLAADDTRRYAIRLANPLSAVRPLLTTTLAPGLLEAGARNVGRGHGSLALSLTAPVFLPGREPLPPAPVPGVDQRPSDDALKALDEALPAQPLHVAVLLAGDRRPAGWWGAAEPASWADAIEIVRRLGRSLGVSVDVRSAEQAPWHPGRCAEVRVDGRVIGHAGELHPRVCRDAGLPVRSAYAEVDLDVLLQAAPPVVTAVEFSTQPLAKEDVALVVDEAVAAADVAAALRDGAGDLLEAVRLFDVYRGHPVPAGRKSLAFALRFRAPDRTLTEQEIAAARNAAVETAVVRLGAERRS